MTSWGFSVLACSRTGLVADQDSIGDRVQLSHSATVVLVSSPISNSVHSVLDSISGATRFEKGSRSESGCC